MEKILPVYVLIFAILLAAALLAVKSDGLRPQKLAKIRVRVEENRRKGFSEPREGEFNPARAVELLLAGAMLLLLWLLLSRV